MKNIFSVKGITDYLLQVSLIIISLLIATGVNRCNEEKGDRAKLAEYLDDIEQDITQELEVLSRNLVDAENDYADLERSIATIKNSEMDSLQVSLMLCLRVLGRGVFRTFEPTTFDLMTSSGDVLLIDDMDYRRQMANFVDFRISYLKGDLQRHDDLILETARKLSEFLDLACATNTRGGINCLLDEQGYRKDVSNTLVILLRATELRIFHLEVASSYGEEVLRMTREQIALL